MTNPIAFLGEAAALDTQAWVNFVAGQQAALDASWARARDARARLKKVRETLGVPFIVDSPTEAGAPGAWNSDFEKNALEVQAMVTFLSGVSGDALAGKRAVVFNNQQKTFGLELLDSDTLRMAVNAQGRPVMLNAKTGEQVTEFSGTISAVPPLIVAGIVVVAVVAVWAAVDQVCKSIESTATRRMTETLSDNATKLVESGKATPEQAAAINKGLLEGSANLVKAEGEKEEAKGQWPRTIRTVAWVALGVGVLWVAGNLVASRGASAGTPMLARNPLSAWFPRKDQADSFAASYRARGIGARVSSSEGGYRVVVDTMAA